MNYYRPVYQLLKARLSEPRRLIQVITGPRQVGKTTLVLQLHKMLGKNSHYISGDEVPAFGSEIWFEEQWQKIRSLVHEKQDPAFLFVDEVHKISNWSAVVKKNWDEDSRMNRNIKLILLGSAQLLLQKGLADALTGRFEVTYLPQWSFTEMHDAFGFTPEQFIWFGGYPGGSALIHDESRWKSYIRESIIRPAVQQDILQMTRIDKPALLSRLFELACLYSGQIISLQKITGILQDAGNVTTLANYLNLLSEAGFITGLNKFYGKILMRRASPPKMQVHDNALMTALMTENFKDVYQDKSKFGRLVESCIGSELLKRCRTNGTNLFYWRNQNEEIDFILEEGIKITAIEIKSGAEKPDYRTLSKFKDQFPGSTIMFISESEGISWKQFLVSINS